MYRIIISKNGQQIVLRPTVEAEDAIYWVNRLSEMNYTAEVVREEAVRSMPDVAMAELA